MKRRATLSLLGRAGLVSLAGLVLGGCGFKLRGPQNYTFQKIAVMPNPGGALNTELRRSFGDTVQVLEADQPLTKAQVVIDILQELREVNDPRIWWTTAGAIAEHVETHDVAV